MPTPTPSLPRFDTTPLITPEHLAADPQAALAARPAWVRHMEFITPEVDPEAYPAVHPVVILWAGKTHTLYEAHTPLAVATMFEATRLPGVSIAVDHNGVRSLYLRFTVQGIGEDLTTVSRFITNAMPDEQVLKTKGREFDMRAETLGKRPARKPSKDGRAILMAHIERIARAWEDRGDMPDHLSADAYLANLHRLLHLCDLEATGKELLGLLPIDFSEQQVGAEA